MDINRAAALEALSVIYDELKPHSEAGIDALCDLANALGIGVHEIISEARERRIEALGKKDLPQEWADLKAADDAKGLDR